MKITASDWAVAKRKPTKLKKRSNGRPFGDKELGRFARMLEQGLSIPEISAKLGRPESTLYRRVAEGGGLTEKNGRRAPAFTDWEKEFTRRCRKKGISFVAIGKRIGRNPNSLRNLFLKGKLKL